jgi:hypothetical protein
MHVARKTVEFGEGDQARLSVAAGASQGGGSRGADPMAAAQAGFNRLGKPKSGAPFGGT